MNRERMVQQIREKMITLTFAFHPDTGCNVEARQQQPQQEGLPGAGCSERRPPLVISPGDPRALLSTLPGGASSAAAIACRGRRRVYVKSGAPTAPALLFVSKNIYSKNENPVRYTERQLPSGSTGRGGDSKSIAKRSLLLGSLGGARENFSRPSAMYEVDTSKNRFRSSVCKISTPADSCFLQS